MRLSVAPELLFKLYSYPTSTAIMSDVLRECWEAQHASTLRTGSVWLWARSVARLLCSLSCEKFDFHYSLSVCFYECTCRHVHRCGRSVYVRWTGVCGSSSRHYLTVITPSYTLTKIPSSTPDDSWSSSSTAEPAGGGVNVSLQNTCHLFSLWWL